MTDDKLVERLRGEAWADRALCVEAASAPEASEAENAALAAENATLREKVARAHREMANVIVQADCLRHYARIADGTKAAPLPTVGELQAGHFEDIAVRAFPDLVPLLEEKRADRAALRQEAGR